jgi:hypothetical protein
MSRKTVTSEADIAPEKTALLAHEMPAQKVFRVS